jgi:hypothetical protein
LRKFSRVIALWLSMGRGRVGVVALLAGLVLAGSALPAPAAPKKHGDVPAPNSTGCDPIDPSVCLYPWPDDAFTNADPSTPTGRRLALRLQDMPTNAAGKPIDPTDWNTLDGFSPGASIVTKVPGLDNPTAFAKTGSVPITDIGQSFRRAAPVVVIDATTGQRWPIWTELDANAHSDADRTLIIRPAKNFTEGHRYVVALRNLRRADGSKIEAGPAFRALRDGTHTDDADLAARRPHFDASVFPVLQHAGIARKDLYLAWDFTVASAKSLAGRLLSIRNDAFAQLGDTNLGDGVVQGHAPPYTLTRVIDYLKPATDPLCGTPASPGNVPVVDVQCGTDTNSDIAYDVRGTMDVPCYLDTPACAPAHSQFLLDSSGTPMRLPGNVMKVDFECRIPRAALGNPGQSRPSLYGHGLFGDYTEVKAGNVGAMANEHNFTFCATRWEGMAETDVPNVATILGDLSNFPTLADRVQQGIVNFLYLGRLMIHPDGLASQAPFKGLLDTQELYYDGNSQGGIIGGALTAVAPDFTRAVLGVPGMNYSTLLTRSTDFGTGQPPHPDPTDPSSVIPEYAYPLYTAYPKELERPLILALIQDLWDRAEPDGYAEHMTSNPYPGTPAHTVLMHLAFGDHQVANIAAETEARTIGAFAQEPALDPGRANWDALYGIPAIPSFPFGGSAIVYWDSGVPAPPTTNTAPSGPVDPHGHPRSTRAARAQKAAFLAPDGKVIDTCGGAPCHTDQYQPPTG